MSIERIQEGTSDYIELLFHWHRYLMASKIANNQIVLDISCGSGYGSYCLAQTATKVIGVDIDESSITYARERYKKDNLEFLVGDARRIPCSDHSIDLVVSFETIEHLDQKDQETFLLEIKRVLKPNGQFLISTPDKHRTDLFSVANPFHLKELYYEELTAILKKHFNSVKTYLQEVNIGSFIWNEHEDKEFPSSDIYKIIINEGKVDRTDKPIQNHLYMIALCSLDNNSQLSLSLNSICHEVKRVPLENLWRIIDLKDQNLREARLKYEREIEDLLIKNEIYEKRIEEVIDELNAKKITVEQLLEEKEQFRKRIKLLMEDKELLQKQIQELKKDKEIYQKQIEHLLLEFKKNQQTIESLQQDLQSIYEMRTWKLIKVYRYIMDQTLLGRFLGKIRNLILFILGKKRRGHY